jgi:drug/metabolite transporter (DMT)-like permease
MQPTGRWKLGLFLALLTAAMWGLLPVALKLLLATLDPFTLTWFRFLAAAGLLGAFLGWRRRLPSARSLGRGGAALLGISVLGLAGNYLLYVMGLERVTPATSQMVIQLAPVFLLLGGLVLFREPFAPVQWLGFGLLVMGLLLFFNDRYHALAEGQGRYYAGVLITVAAALSWAGYALAQKGLLRRLASEQILVLVYAGSAVVLTPAAEPGRLAGLANLQIWLLAFASLNTVIAYGAFAEALVHWEASRVSAVLSITPLLTLAVTWTADSWWPGLLAPDPVNALSLLGAGLVVAGSALTALGGRRRVTLQPE